MDGGSRTTAVPTVVVGGVAAGTPVACRWNPTKEQVNMLENLYGQGLRTPTAEQIQEITSRLRTYGHIEGKNVFYWFQNHKARQRQKEKHDHLTLFRQYHQYRHQPFFSLPPSPNVVYEPCYRAQNNLGFYAHQPQPLSPSTSSVIKRRSPRATKPKPLDGAGFSLTYQPESASAVAVAGGNNMMSKDLNEIKINNSQRETLDLFPLHPTGILQE